MRRLQFSSKFRLFEFTALTAIFLFNSSTILPVLADQENIDNAVSVPPSTGLVAQTPQMAIDPVLASAYSDRVGKMEEVAFGASYAEHELNDRLDHLEEEIFKNKISGSPELRITKLESKVFGRSAFTGGSQSPTESVNSPILPGPSTVSPTIAPQASEAIAAPSYSGGNLPPVIISGVPSNQSLSNQPYMPVQPTVSAKPKSSAAPPPAVQPYQGTAPYSANNYYPINQNYGSQRPPTPSGSYGYAYPYGNQNSNQNYQGYRSGYPSNYQATQIAPYQYGSGNQPYSGQGYQQYQPFRPSSVQQPAIPRQPYTQPYQQYPPSQYLPSQYSSTPYPSAQYAPGAQTQAPPYVNSDSVQPLSSKNSVACEKVASAIPQSSKDGDYFPNIRHFIGNTSMHWQTFPVIVLLPKDSPDSWRRALEGDVRKWGQYVPLSLAKAEEKAKIDVQWVNKLPAKILGVTRISGCADDLKVTVFVLRPTFYPSEIPENVLQNVFAHELGHALGLLGHSDNSADVMYIHDDKQDKTVKSGDKPKSQFGSDRPSSRDLNTLKKLYTSAPLSASFKLEQPLEYSSYY